MEIMNDNTEVEKAHEYYQRGDRIMARSLLATAVKRDPKNIRAWALLSVIVDDPDQKKYCLNRILDVDPNNKQALNMLNAQFGVEQAAVKMDNAVKLQKTAAAIGSISWTLILIGVLLPCIVICVGALLTK